MPKRRTLMVAVAVAASFAALVAAIIFLSAAGIVSFEMSKLMLVALLAMYIGFGFLVAVYRFISRLD